MHLWERTGPYDTGANDTMPQITMISCLNSHSLRSASRNVAIVWCWTIFIQVVTPFFTQIVILLIFSTLLMKRNLFFGADWVHNPLPLRSFRDSSMCVSTSGGGAPSPAPLRSVLPDWFRFSPNLAQLAITVLPVWAGNMSQTGNTVLRPLRSRIFCSRQSPVIRSSHLPDKGRFAERNILPWDSKVSIAFYNTHRIR